MINFTGIDPNSSIKRPFQSKNNTVAKFVKTGQDTTFAGKNHRKITFTEGIKIFGNGIAKQGCEIVDSIIEHPVRTIAIAAGTAAALYVLPFIGIPTAVGGAVLAVGFAGYAISKTVLHAVNFIQHNKQGKYNLARRNLEQLGEDTIDIALSAPFAPKAIARLNNFASAGKVGFNSALANELKSVKTFTERMQILKTYDKNLSRSINYKAITERELAKLKNITEAEKNNIRQYILDYNVPKEQIPEVALEQWAKARGILTKPDLSYASMPSNTGGYALPKECVILLNDYKTQIAPNTFSRFSQLSSRLNKNNQYEITYKDTQTGRVFTETIDKNILDSYKNLYEIESKLTPEARQILVTTHEREHIHQYAQIFAQKGTSWLSPTDRAQALYRQMIKDMPVVNPGSKEAQIIDKMATETASGTAVSYVKDLKEIYARKAESELLHQPNFQKLNTVLAKTNKIVSPSTTQTVLLNTLRPESAAS